MSRLRVLTLAALVAAAAPALAVGQATIRQARPEPAAEARRSSALDAVLACRAQTDGQARLACYDAAIGTLQQAQTTGDVVVVDREQVQQARRSLFGFTLPSIDLFDRGPQRPQDRVDEITSTLQSVRQDRSGKNIYTLADGSVWRQYNNDYIRARPNDPVRVTRGSIGSYFIHIGNQAGTRAQRIQ